MSFFIKDPDAILDYQIDWTEWLDGDTITTSTWQVPAGLTASSDSNTDTSATVWLSSGTADTDYSVVNHITTQSGRQDHRTITIKCKNR